MYNKILLTRSNIDNQKAIQKLKSHQISCISIPLLKFDYINYNNHVISKYKNFIFSSKNALNVVLPLIKYEATILVVGEKLKILASKYNKRQNFEIKAFSNISSLEKNIPKHQYNNFLYLTGTYITKKLPIKRLIVYKTTYLEELSPNELCYLREQKITHILIYSYNTCFTFIGILKKYNLLDQFKNSNIITRGNFDNILIRNGFLNFISSSSPIEYIINTLGSRHE